MAPALGFLLALAATSVRAQPIRFSEQLADHSDELARADALLAAHRVREALALYEVATRGRTAAAGLAGKGRALLALGRRAEAVSALRVAVERERDGPRRAEYLIALGDACRADGAPECAADSYLQVLREESSVDAAARYRSLGVDAFAHGYAFGPGQPTATDRLPRASPGFVYSLGVGTQYGGDLGAQVGYDFRVIDRACGFTPYLSLGAFFASARTPFLPMPVVGVMSSLGRGSRLLADLSLGGAGISRLQVFDATVAWRRVYAWSSSVGGEIGFARFLFIRGLVGISLPIDRTLRSPLWAVSLGLGVKP